MKPKPPLPGDQVILSKSDRVPEKWRGTEGTVVGVLFDGDRTEVTIEDVLGSCLTVALEEVQPKP
jgi:hypothetical protein